MNLEDQDPYDVAMAGESPIGRQYSISQINDKMRVVIIRHGESENNIRLQEHGEDYQLVRDHDAQLTENGREQAKELGDYFAAHEDFSITDIWCSPAIRSMQTAEILGTALDIKPFVKQDLHEVKGCYLNGNPLPGLPLSEMQARFQNCTFDENCTEQGWWLKDRLETDEEADERAKNVWKLLLEMAKDEENSFKTICIVTHGMILDFLMGALANRAIQGTPRFTFFNTGYTLIEMQDPHPVFYYLNRIDHLQVMPLLYRRGKMG